MKKKNLFLGCLLLGWSLSHAQVGINNEAPKATLHIVPMKTDASTAEGIIAPNLTRAQLISKDTQYTALQKGAMVYVTDESGTLTTKTSKIKSPGYYYFDGNVWQAFSSSEVTIPTEPWNVQGGTSAATSNTQNIYQMGSVGIGSSAAVPSSYQFQVTGNSNITGNSTIGGNEYISGVSKIGGTSTSNSSAQLELGASDKAFLPNRVPLVSTEQNTPVTSVVDGMLVYNTTTDESLNLKPGYYMWQDSRWNRLVNEIPSNNVQMLNLASNVVTNPVVDVRVGGLLARKMTFPDITIPEDGSYAFSFRLYGDITRSTSRRCLYYIYLACNNIIQDAAELDLVVLASAAESNDTYSYSVTLSCKAKKGDIVNFRICHNSTINTPWTLTTDSRNSNPVRTSMVWWKL